MSLKRNFQTLDTFSLSSMTDVIFLLLIFFMVTSTFVFPTAIDVTLPQSAEQTKIKPATEVYLDSLAGIYLVADRTSDDPALRDPRQVSAQELADALLLLQRQDSTRSIALYGDAGAEYGKIVEILDLAARNNLRMILATRASQKKLPRQHDSRP